MQLVEGGPHLPEALLEAHDEGKLVFFCGAGVSARAGLPLFRGLVGKIGDPTGVDFRGTRDWESERYDRVLGLLERECGRDAIRSRVREILATPIDSDTETHRAIIELSGGSDAESRLVTTNFDSLFEAADPNLLPVVAPALPVPKPGRWRGIVHIHGSIDSEAAHGDLDMVLTSGDFGLAYLVEGWASRFFSELVRNYSVLFVGYQAEDLVMRYLCDALDAERPDRAQDVFAFAPFGEVAEGVTRKAWESKRITPILYNELDRHRLLHETLREWARQWRGGQMARLEDVARFGKLEPSAAPSHCVTQVCRHIARSRALAGAFARLQEEAPVGWLGVFDEAGVLNSLRSDRSLGPELCGSSPVTAGRLSGRQYAIATWLVAHLETEELVEWALERGGVLHPQFAELVWRRLTDATLSEAFRVVWEQLAHPSRMFRPRSWLASRVISRAGEEPWGPSLKEAVVDALEPRLYFMPRLRSVLLSNDEERRRPRRGSWRARCRLSSGDTTQLLVRTLRQRARWEVEITDLALELPVLLRQALDLLAGTNQASGEWDPGRWVLSRLDTGYAPHWRDDWQMLVPLNVEMLRAADRHRPQALTLAIEFLKEVRYPSARRLLLHCVENYGQPSPKWLVANVIAEPEAWLWGVPARDELRGAVRRIWESEPEARSELANVIFNGPPREVFGAGLTEGEWAETKEDMLWRVGQGLIDVDGLPEDKTEALKALRDRQDRQHAAHGSRGESEESDADTLEAARSGTGPELLAALERLSTRPFATDVGLEELFRRDDGTPTLRLINELAGLDEAPARVWRSVLDALYMSKIAREIPDAVLAVLSPLTDEVLTANQLAVARILETASEALRGGAPNAFIETWMRLFAASVEAQDDE